jgi:hypothetical protein
MISCANPSQKKNFSTKPGKYYHQIKRIQKED